jgi:hypothetical protein
MGLPAGAEEGVDLEALEAFANRLLKIVAQQKPDRNEMDRGSQRKLATKCLNGPMSLRLTTAQCALNLRSRTRGKAKNGG